MSECTHDCSSCSANCDSRKQDNKFKTNQFSKIKRVIGVVSGKGGVGKSAVTSMLAVLMKRKGYNVAVLDADITGPSIPKAFGLKQKATADESMIFPVVTKTGIEVMSINLLLEDESAPVVWRGPVLAGAVKQFYEDVCWNEVDYMFVDMPPGTGDIPLTVMQDLPIDGVVAVTTPQSLAKDVATKALNMAKMLKVPILAVVENQSYFDCPKCGKKHYIYGESDVEGFAKKFGVDVTATLPINGDFANQADRGLIELYEGDYLENIVDRIEQC